MYIYLELITHLCWHTWQSGARLGFRIFHHDFTILLQMPPKPPDNKEWVWVCGKDMVWDSPVKLQPKLIISDDNPLF